MKKNITDYKIIQENSAATLQSIVKSLIEDGWQPFGSAFSRSTGNFSAICQTMVKYQNELNIHE